MYTVISQTSIEFYYKDDTILAIAERDSAYKAKRTVNKEATKDLIDIANYSVDESEFGYEALRLGFTDLFTILEKAMSATVYFHNAGTSHGSDHYTGFYLNDYENHTASQLELIDNLFTMAAAYYVLHSWYLLTPLEGLTKYYTSKYLQLKQDLTKITFNLRKPGNTNIISIVSNRIKSHSVKIDIPARVLTDVPHPFAGNFNVEISDSAGKEIGEGIIQTRGLYKIQVYASIALPGTNFYFIGDS